MRLLTFGEQAQFLSRHPIVAARVAETKAFLLAGRYDQILDPPAWYEIDVNIGLIPPVGIEVDDSVFQRVIVYPAPNGEIYFNAFVPEGIDTTINEPQYPGDPGAPEGHPPEPPFNLDFSWFKALAVVAVAILALGVFKK
jgi:hypothetical protein